MGVCSSSASSSTGAAASSEHLRFPAASVGSSKFGPYVKSRDGNGYRLENDGGAEELGLPVAFPSQKELREWLLKHVTVEGKSGETIVRQPGSLRGAQFIISDCNNCDIILLDHTSTVSVDRCKNCRILIGPCDSSVFLRDCSECTFAIATRQLRTRDCRDINVRLFCGTAPVIEKSRRVRLACWTGGWFELERQLELCALSPFQNRWAEVHDFTPPSGGGGQNWSLLQLDESTNALFRIFDGHLCGAGAEDVVPKTSWPYRGMKSGSDSLLLFDATAAGLSLGAKAARELAQNGDLVDCKHQTMLPDAWKALSASLAGGKNAKKNIASKCVFQGNKPGRAAAQPVPHPQTMVLRVSQSVIADKLSENIQTAIDVGHGAILDGAARWFDNWVLVV